MSIVELKRAIESKKLGFGLKEVLKGKAEKVFLPSDIRSETEELIKAKGVEIMKLREDRERITKDLKLPFLSEVFFIKGKFETKEKKEEKKAEKKEKKPRAKKEKKEEAKK